MNLTPENESILIIEDDHVLGQSVMQGLSEQGYSCTLTSSGIEGADLAANHNYRVIILDLALSDDSGLGVLRCIRDANDKASVLLLTPLEFRTERLRGLEAGADDFCMKPFTLREILARVEAALIRSRSRPQMVLEVGPLSMDLSARRVTNAGRNVTLTPTEFRILEILSRNHGKVVTRRMLCEFLWNPDWEGVTNVIEVHINRLRNKLQTENGPRLIHTVRGSGYSLRVQESVRQEPMISRALEAT